MQNWLPDKDTLKRPRYRSLMEAIETAIERGTLPPGERLPTHRDLAYQLGISVQTVSRAYTRLIEAGLVVGEVGRGSYVRGGGGDTALPFPAVRAGTQILDLALLKPVVGDIQKEAMRRTLQRIAQDLPNEILSSFRASTIANRHAPIVDSWLLKCGVSRQDRDAIPTNGNTSAMTVALMSVAHSGDLIVTESMGHHTLPPLCRSLGLRLRGLAMDDEGILPEALDQACRVETVKALFVMPRAAPTACFMGAERRREIVRVARSHNIAILENDGWGPLAAGAAQLPLAALAPERTLYFTGLTKCLMPGLRVGFLVVPPAYAATARERHMVTNWMVTPLMHEIATQWIADGTASALCDWQQTQLARRGALAHAMLADSDIRITPSGLQAWMPCPDIGSEARLVERSREAGILISPGSTFSIGPLAPKPGVRISLGVQDIDALRRALQVVQEINLQTRSSL